ncbi:hypothetical protein DSM25558_5118 [Agrobacterium sp. DSM 25558]|uniref:hypothetical protein n=1 Tax=Agrobacterium sp. DSM 25558 TaxID=1907665 RepID=UPI0009725BF8|nr:hypothetical protein [Agrobacterium sp. DSM 25558]SCX31095.1 hypothetical protein DSM25558_5118 [Agrobacterium sp. DSM 25558]
METPAPANWHNLKRRADALGMVITRHTTKQEAITVGGHRYTLRLPEQSTSGLPRLSLEALKTAIAGIEQRNAIRDGKKPTARMVLTGIIPGPIRK